MSAWIETPDNQVVMLGGSCLIGRTLGNNVVLDDGKVSGRHALIQCVEELFWIADLRSKNGTRLNRRSLLKPIQLHDNDVIDIVGHKYRFRTDDDPVNGRPLLVSTILDKPPRNSDVFIDVGEELVALDGDGAILDVPTDRARDWLETYFDWNREERNHLPEELREWIALHSAEDRAAQAAIDSPPEGFFKPHGDSKMNVHLQAAGRKIKVLKLSLQQRVFSIEVLRRVGLTPRQAELVIWIAEGKSNADIGIILKITRRTVEKHIENIMTELGVESRLSIVTHVLHACGMI